MVGKNRRDGCGERVLRAYGGQFSSVVQSGSHLHAMFARYMGERSTPSFPASDRGSGASILVDHHATQRLYGKSNVKKTSMSAVCILYPEECAARTFNYIVQRKVALVGQGAGNRPYAQLNGFGMGRRDQIGGMRLTRDNACLRQWPTRFQTPTTNSFPTVSGVAFVPLYGLARSGRVDTLDSALEAVRMSDMRPIYIT